MPANSTKEQCTNKSEVHLWYQPCWSTKSFLSILSQSYLLYVLVADVQYCVVDRYVPCCRTLAGTGAEIPSVGQPQSGFQQMQEEYMAQMEAFAEQIALMVANTCVPMSSSSESSSTMMSLAEQQFVMALSLLNSAYFLYSFAMRVSLLLSTSMRGLLRYSWMAWRDPSSELSSTTTTRQLVYSCLAMESKQLRYRRRNRVLRPVLTTHRDSCLVAQRDILYLDQKQYFSMGGQDGWQMLLQREYAKQACLVALYLLLVVVLVWVDSCYIVCCMVPPVLMSGRVVWTDGSSCIYNQAYQQQQKHRYDDWCRYAMVAITIIIPITAQHSPRPTLSFSYFLC